MSFATLPTRAALGVLRQYPQAWRDRYEREVSGLIEDSTLRWRDVAELVCGMLAERTRELLSSIEHPRRTRAVLSLVYPLFGVLFLSTAMAAAAALREFVEVGSAAGENLLSVTLIAVAVVDLILLGLGRSRANDADEAKYKSWVAPVLLPGLLALATLYIAAVALEPVTSTGTVAPFIPYARWFIVLGLGSMAADLASCLLPSRRMLAAFDAVDGAAGWLASARTLVEGCHATMALGLAAPLTAAEADVAKWTRKLDAAQQRLHALSYQARFRGTRSAARLAGSRVSS